MKLLSLMLMLLVTVPVPAALARGHDSRHCVFNSSCCDWPARWAARHGDRDARLAITTRDGDVTMYLTGEVVALQLSDRTMHRITREMRDEREDEADNPLARAIKTAVISGVRTLLDHSAECPIRELRDVDYRDGELVFIAENGDRVFDDIDVHNEDLSGAFAPDDARVFVREFRRLKARAR